MEIIFRNTPENLFLGYFFIQNKRSLVLLDNIEKNKSKQVFQSDINYLKEKKLLDMNKLYNLR